MVPLNENNKALSFEIRSHMKKVQKMKALVYARLESKTKSEGYFLIGYRECDDMLLFSPYTSNTDTSIDHKKLPGKIWYTYTYLLRYPGWRFLPLDYPLTLEDAQGLYYPVHSVG